MSTEIALSAEGLGKRYRIGTNPALTTSAREVLSGALRSAGRPFGGRSRASARSEFWALREVSFSVPRGAVLGIVGRNGAGKSTLLKILSEVTEPTEGRVHVAGRIGSLLEVGTGFHPELSGRENIFLNAAILGMSKREVAAKFDEIVEFSGVERFLDMPVKRYSSGMYLRLAFSVAAHLDSDILIVDEVLAVGDAEFQKRCLAKINDVNRSGRTVLFVSHSVHVVERLADRILWLDGGRVVQEGADVGPIVERYLRGSTTRPHEQRLATWENAGSEYVNPWCRPLRMYIGGPDREPLAMPLRHDQGAFLYLEYHVEEADPALSVGYALYADHGGCVFESFHTDQPEADWPGARAGVTVLRTPLPLRMLNEGAYSIELLGSLHRRQALFDRGATSIRVDVEVRGGLSRSPYWTERRPGVLAPVLPWERCEVGLQALR